MLILHVSGKIICTKESRKITNFYDLVCIESLNMKGNEPGFKVWKECS